MEIVEKYYSELISAVRPAFSEEEAAIINKAYEFALNSHGEQLRKSGEPYIIHPISVAKILIGFGMDCQSVVAALLHDVVEDTPVTSEEVRRLFGADVQLLVDGVTKLGKVPLQGKEEQQAENLRKLLLAMSEDIRVIIIKLADRLHNMRTLKYVPEQKRRDTAKETIEIYAPIAHRLGIRPVKEELEDLAISYLDPIAYSEIEEALADQEPLRKEFLDNIKEKIAVRIKTVVSDAVVQGRIKSVHGIYRKMYMQGKSFEEIYDIYAVRIIVDTVGDCYNCLGVIHDMYKPIQGRFKDYISTPKPNMYQSLHTTLIGKEGIPFEVQIRTEEMHKTAEYGIAAHWKYKLGYKDKDADKKLEKGIGWVKHLLEAQSETGDATDILNTIKHDFVSDEVYVFTPKGDVICLPVGATVIDFAYAIHSAVGNKMTGAKVDKRIVQLNYVVKTGEIVEVLTSSQPGKGPSRDWLNIVTTNEARTKIRTWFKRERRDENIIEGKALYEAQLRRNNMHLTDEQNEQLLLIIIEKQKLATTDDFYAALGYGGIVLSKLMPMIKDEYNKIVKTMNDAAVKYKQAKTVSSEGVVVDGISNCLIKLSRCCNPIPGDDIIGFITRGHGVSVHKRDCPNVPEDTYNTAEAHRWIRVYWNSTVKADFSASMLLTCLSGKTIMNDIFMALNAIHVTVQSINTRGTKDGRLLVNLTIAANSVEHLKSVMLRLGKLSGVLSVDRSGSDI
ncbi:MAG: bifunctional (p)ppGpp synthetase/guanosine-3',5'-bis(diphosphate) 3'-pyrophosphohydrolase [Clostridia bacterium]|nr:bifunctional (p)ppGpp synthetase/guanosine-3',5'-bis(diphosphate) 3'-pyrophosphohydrolase [Oscillospiraceae bacterium]MBR2411856.1 bifunctional (p)ppGpp synthetase/guanosine-3',5'-bis(diphosphate) 3'-pyrophosphohydrolase [Clostridia bacterium]